MTLRVVFFLLSSLLIAISYKYFTFLRPIIFKLIFLFFFKLRGELLYKYIEG